MHVSQFIAKWRQVELTERSAAQQHFLDLCEVLDHHMPAAPYPLVSSIGAERRGYLHPHREAARMRYR